MHRFMKQYYYLFVIPFPGSVLLQATMPVLVAHQN